MPFRQWIFFTFYVIQTARVIACQARICICLIVTAYTSNCFRFFVVIRIVTKSALAAEVIVGRFFEISTALALMG